MEKEEVFSVEGNEAAAVFGQFDCNVKKIEKEFKKDEISGKIT